MESAAKSPQHDRRSIFHVQGPGRTTVHESQGQGRSRLPIEKRAHRPFSHPYFCLRLPCLQLAASVLYVCFFSEALRPVHSQTTRHYLSLSLLRTFVQQVVYSGRGSRFSASESWPARACSATCRPTLPALSSHPASCPPMPSYREQPVLLPPPWFCRRTSHARLAQQHQAKRTGPANTLLRNGGWSLFALGWDV